MAIRLSFHGLIKIAAMLPFLLPAAGRDVIVEFYQRNETIKAILDFVQAKQSRPTASRGELTNELVATLQRISYDTQEEVMFYCIVRDLLCDYLWLENEVAVAQVDQEAVEYIGNISNVKRVRSATQVVRPTEVSQDPPKEPEKFQPLEQTRARCGAIDTDCLGNGTVVAFIGAGMMWNHTELKDNYRGDYGWLDPQYKTKDPATSGNDWMTRVAGLAVGRTKGVAPGAWWMACLAFPDDYGTERWVKKCGEFVLCPCKFDNETDRNCFMSPDVVINPWHFPLETPRSAYYVTVMAWNAVGIMHTFPVGNDNHYCAGTRAPAIYDISFGVGAVNGSSTLPRWSVRGPGLAASWDSGSNSSSAVCKVLCGGTNSTNVTTLCTIIKPDICGPGVNLISPIPTNDTAFDLSSGTDFAASVVGGVMSLMVCANDELVDTKLNQTVATAYLRKTASKERIDQSMGNKNDNYVRISKLMCDMVSSQICEGEYPNNLFGAGEVDACAAVALTRKNAKKRVGKKRGGVSPSLPCSA